MNTRSRTKQILHEQLNRANELQEDGDHSLDTLDILRDIIEETNRCTIDTDIKERACNTDEVLLDAKVISLTTNLYLNAVDAFDIHMDAYNIDDFAQNLTRYLKDGDEEFLDWEKLEDDVISNFKLTPTFSYIYGTFKEKEITPSQEARRRVTRAKFEQCERQKPDSIKVIDKEEEGVDETVKSMLSILRENCKQNDSRPISFYHFIIDTDDFSKTVDNIFHFAFLIRDGAVKITIDDDQLPYVTPVSRSVNKRGRDDEHAENTQRVFSLDWNEWMELKEHLNIEKGIYSTVKKSRQQK